MLFDDPDRSFYFFWVFFLHVCLALWNSQAEYCSLRYSTPLDTSVKNLKRLLWVEFPEVMDGHRLKNKREED